MATVETLTTICGKYVANRIHKKDLFDLRSLPNDLLQRILREYVTRRRQRRREVKLEPFLIASIQSLDLQGCILGKKPFSRVGLLPNLREISLINCLSIGNEGTLFVHLDHFFCTLSKQ